MPQLVRSVMPADTIVMVQLTIKPGGYNDSSRGWAEGWATRSKAGAVYLKCFFEVTDDPFAGKNFSHMIGLFTPKGPWWGDEGRKMLCSILNSANGLSSSDHSTFARRHRVVQSLGVFNEIKFLAEIGRQEGTDGVLRNTLKAAVTSDDPRSEGRLVSTRSAEPETESSAEIEGFVELDAASSPGSEPLWLRRE